MLPQTGGVLTDLYFMEAIVTREFWMVKKVVHFERILLKPASRLSKPTPYHADQVKTFIKIASQLDGS